MVKKLSYKNIQRLVEYSKYETSFEFIQVCKNCNHLYGEHFGRNCCDGKKTLFSVNKHLTKASMGFYKTVLKGKLKNTYISEQEALEYGIRTKSQDHIWKI